MDLKIDPEFAGKIPPLTDEEYRQLEENILADGRVINPLIVWNGVIVDGHNRYRIVQAHPEVPYDTFEKDFPDRFAVIAWICRNQLGRRNLTPEQRKYLIGKQYEAEKASVPNAAGKNQFSEEVSGQNVRWEIHQAAGLLACAHGSLTPPRFSPSRPKTEVSLSPSPGHGRRRVQSRHLQ